ncbi:hypothetical protein [Gallintestinimicrobium propionicum]|nr:hypothetical protein [Gallintestinimicrobium propionicum]
MELAATSRLIDSQKRVILFYPRGVVDKYGKIHRTGGNCRGFL